MITRFAKPYTVTKRPAGEYVDGVYVHDTPTTITVRMDIQPVTNTTAQMVESLPEGRRSRESRVAYAPLESGITILDAETGAPGDLVSVDGRDWMFVSEAHFGTLGGRTAHTVFIIQREIEHVAGEAVL